MKLTTPDFIKNAIEIHGDKYDYSKVNYINAQTKVCIICSEHGEFWQTPHNHITNKAGCPNVVNIINVIIQTHLLKLPKLFMEINMNIQK